jgi:phosphoenolpyruvate-protein kinase (PTS system EI component)
MTGEVAQRIVAAVHAAADAGDQLAVAAALHSVEPGDLARFFHASLVDQPGTEPLAVGLPASPGVASGRIMLSASAAIAAAERGEQVILVRRETTPEDVLGIQMSAGLLTSRGGLVSHAAVVARGWGIPAVVGTIELTFDEVTGHQAAGDGAPGIVIGTTALREGDHITIDGSTGHVHAGQLATRGEEPPGELETLLRWADAVAAGHVQVRANADTEADASIGRSRGAQGIGLCRTEHMFLAADRLELMRRFIMSDDPATEAEVLAALETAQTRDFESLLAAMDGLPVTVRLLDPPLHEFLPDLLDLAARESGAGLDDAGREQLAAVRRLHEVNPMLGTRGVRLGVMRSGIYEMQVRALCCSATNLFERGLHPHVELMIPLVVDAEELRIARSWVTAVLDEIGHPQLASDTITVGAMIETPRAALTAGALAEHADFFSFGTNDLTQLTYAFSRDDVESKLLPAYQALGILPANPFAVLDREGVGALLRIACEAAVATKPGIGLGVCGEHAGDPSSTEFLVRLGISSVSCSPFRIPLARLGVAQALLSSGRVDIDDVTFDYGQVAPRGADPTSVDPPADIGPPLDVERPLDIGEPLVLHVLRLRGFVTEIGFVESLGVHPASILESLVATGDIRFVEARGVYALVEQGRQRHAALLGELHGPDPDRFHEPYTAFLAANGALKALCTRWQIRDGAPNDHSDADYDQRCLEDLARLSDEAQSIIGSLSAILPRFARYGPRLRLAAEQAAAGNHRMFTGVGCGSFHDIWMELHEDLVVLQRIDRASEGSF